MTLNNIEAIFKDIAERHKQVNSFYNQQAFDITSVNEVIYPSIVINTSEVSLPKGQAGYNTKSYSIELQFIDLVHKDENNKQEVLSDGASILNDMISELSTHPIYIEEGIDLINDITLNPLRNAYGDEVSGWNTLLTLQLPNRVSWCGSPLAALDGFEIPDFKVTITDNLNPDSPIELSEGSYTCFAASNDINVSNSNDSYSVNVTNDLELPNISFTDSDGTTTSVPSMEDIVATACPVKSGIAYTRPYLTNQSTSYALYDDGHNLANGVYDYTPPSNPLHCTQLDVNSVSPLLTLKENNEFGNKNRFTDELGGQTYANDYIIDHLTGLGYIKTLLASDLWTNLLSTANSSTAYIYNDWRVTNINELNTLFSWEKNVGFNYAPFNIIPELYTSTSAADANAANFAVSFLRAGVITRRSKSVSTLQVLLVRNHYN